MHKNEVYLREKEEVMFANFNFQQMVSAFIVLLL